MRLSILLFPSLPLSEENYKPVLIFAYAEPLAIFFVCLFFFNLAASGLSCSTRDLSLQHAGFSIVVTRMFQSTWAFQQVGSAAVVRGLSSCGTQALEHMGLVAAQHVGS